MLSRPTDLTLGARQATLHTSTSRVIAEDEDADDEVGDRGKGSQAKLPPGVPEWPPRPFLASQDAFLKPWKVYLLQDGESMRSEPDPRIA